jgi:hypothetical protein
MTKSLFKATIITLILISLPLSASAWTWHDLFTQKSSAQENDNTSASNLEIRDVTDKYKSGKKLVVIMILIIL